MSSPLKISSTIVLSAYIFIISCGLTVSNIKCSIGDQWILGTEMPTCKYSSNLESFICSSKLNQKMTEENNDKRKKDTIDLKFEFIGNEVLHQHIEYIADFAVLFQESIVRPINATRFISTIKSFLILYPPLDIFDPDLALLQVFRI